jgi:hypothetical protein
MAQQYATVEVWVLVDNCGDTAQGATADEAKERYEEQIQELGACEGFRLVCVKVKVPLPETCVVEITAEAPALEAATATA